MARTWIDIRCTEAHVSKVWQQIVERSGEPTLGATLIRLARMAERVHQGETARRLTLPGRADDRAEPLTPGRGSAVCTEASR